MHHLRTCWILAISLAAAPLAGCDSGDGDSGDGSTTSPLTTTNPTNEPTGGEMTTMNETTGGPEVVTYAEVQEIWTASCVAGCHTPGGTGASTVNLLLDPGTSYDALVGKASIQLPSMSLVTAGDSNQSYLWHKVSTTWQQVGGSGLRMPQGAMLTQDKLDIIKAWIDGGALP